MGYDYGVMFAPIINEVYETLLHALLPSPLEEPVVKLAEEIIDEQVPFFSFPVVIKVNHTHVYFFFSLFHVLSWDYWSRLFSHYRLKVIKTC
jgi:hypothetical protein